MGKTLDRLVTLTVGAVAVAAFKRTTTMTQQMNEFEGKFTRTLEEIDTFTNDIAADLDTLAQRVKDLEADGGVTPQRLEALSTALTNRAEALRAVAAKHDGTDPVPAEPPPVEPA